MRTFSWLLAIVALVVGCGSEQSTVPDEARSDAPPSSYVALGDSFTAGPGIGQIDESSASCFRSKQNFPALLADDLGIDDVVDVSCAGATTRAITEGGDLVPAQAKSVDAGTELITLTIGANDANLLERMHAHCYVGGAVVDTCSAFERTQVPGLMDTIGSNLNRTLAELHQRAPNAQIVVVGYVQVSPADGTCDELGVPAEAANTAHRVERDLEDVLERTAKESGVEFAPVGDRSQDHDACSDDPWVNGVQPPGAEVPLHPNADGARATAKFVAETLR